MRLVRLARPLTPTLSVPPGFLMMCMASRLPLPLSLRMASTASSAKCSLSPVKILLLRVVIAMFSRSWRNAAGGEEAQAQGDTATCKAGNGEDIHVPVGWRWAGGGHLSSTLVVNTSWASSHEIKWLAGPWVGTIEP